MNLSTKWLPENPTSWQIANPKTLFSERTQKSSVSDIHLTPSQKFGVLPQSEYMEMTGGSVVLNLAGSDNMKHVEKNDFIIHLRSFQGGIEHSNYSGKVSNAYCVLKPTQQIEPRYFRWVLKSQGYIQELNATTDQLRDGQSIKFEQFASIGLPLPPIEVQRRIADYLDNQLSIINKMEELSKLLVKLTHEELRAKNEQLFAMSDVPRIPLRRIAKLITEKRNELLPTVSLDLVKARRGTLIVNELPFTEGLTSTKMKKGDIAFGKLRPYLGKVFLATKETFAESEFIVMRADKNLLSEQYLSKYLITHEVLNELESLSVGSKMPRTSWDQIASLMVPVPNLKSQQKINEGIASNESLANKKEALLLELSAKLDEYRISLITGVITGTIEKPWERRK